VSALKPLLDWRWRLFLVWIGVTTAAGAIGCLAPLTETLGYEYALLISLVAALGTGHLAACYPSRVRRQLAPFPGARWPTLLLYARVAIHGLLLLVVPLLLSLLNGIRVSPCNLSEGLLFYLLMPLSSMAIAAAAGLLVGLATPGAKSGSVLWFLLFGAAIFAAFTEFHKTPAVYSFGPFHGFFPGVLYDELIRVDTRMLTYRLAGIVQICALLGIGSWLLEPAALRLSLRRRRTKASSLVLVLLFIALAIALHLLGPELGHRTRRQDLERLLPHRVAVPGLELFFPAGIDPQTADELTADASFSLHQVERFFDAPKGETIAVFFFAGRDQKHAAIGASKTNVAKPWRNEVYVTAEPTPHWVLRHELAHAVAARFGRGPFAIASSLGGLWPDPGLIEGLAVAAGGPRSDLTVHQWAAAMKRQELLPPVSRLFGLGFLDIAQSAAYTAAGSFCRFVHDRHGAAALRQVYAGAGWHAATGKSVDELERAWHAFLERTRLTDPDLAAARYRFDRPSVIGSVCVHEVARLRFEARRAAAESRWDRSLELLEQAHQRSGGTTSTRLSVFHTLVDAERKAQAHELGAELLADPGLGLVRSALVREILADLDSAEHRAATTGVYRDLAAEAAGEDQRRTLQVKSHLAASPNPASAPVLEVLKRRPGTSPTPEPLAMLVIADAAASAPDDPILTYLLARQHFRYRNPQRTLELLEAAKRLGLAGTTPSLLLEARLMQAQSYHALGEFDHAERLFTALAEKSNLREGARELAQDWAERSAFAAAGSKEGRR
jgi:hypothetical protein